MPHFIGLDGGQGSGKSTYAKDLIPRLETEFGTKVSYIETDDFLTERLWRDPLPDDFFRDFSNYRRLWDFERMGEVIGQMQRLGNATLTVGGLYNRQTGKRDREHTWQVNENDVVLVGGPHLLEPELEGVLERTIFLAVPKEERFRRVLKRNRELGRPEGMARKVFNNFENFYIPYWSERMRQYDEVIPN